MTFEQEHIEKLEQLQKQKENDRIQQELDLAIARIENDQIQRDLDAAIESLDQEISHQDENAEEQGICDQASQQSSSTEEELSSQESITKEYLENESSKHDHNMTIEHQDQTSQTPTIEEEVSSHDLVIGENTIQLNSLKQSIYSYNDQHINHQEEKADDIQDVRKNQSDIQISDSEVPIEKDKEKFAVINDSQKIQDEKGNNIDHKTIPRSDWKEEIIQKECNLNENQDKRIPLNEKKKIGNTDVVHYDDKKSKNLLNQGKIERTIYHTHEKILKQDTPQKAQGQKQSEKTNQKELKGIIDKETHKKSHFTKIDNTKKDRLNDEVTVNQEIKILNPKSVEKEWNKYVLMGKPVPEVFQKKVFQQYDSGELKNAGLIKKEGKWFLETTWENYHSVKKYLNNHSMKSFSFQLWADIRTRKPLYFVKNHPSKNLYHSTVIKKSPKIPPGLVKTRLYIRNTDLFFKNGFSEDRFYQSTVKEFERSFMKKLTNWGIRQDRYKEIRDEIFKQYFDKYGKVFNRVKTIHKKPMILKLEYPIDSLENSFIRCFNEHFSRGSRLWKFKNGSGKQSFLEYYQYHDYRSLATLNRLGKREIPKINEINSPFVKLTRECLETNTSSKFIEFTQKWNEFVNNNRVTENMWIVYNKIQTSCNYPFRRFKHIKQITTNQHTIKYYNDLANSIEKLFERRGRFPTSLFETWFTFREIKKGSPPFIKIKIMNPLTGLNEQYYLPNVDYHWNKNPTYKKSNIQKTNKDRTGIRMVMDTIMEEIPIKDSQTKIIRKLIIKELRSKGFCGRKKADVWFKHVYKMKYDNILVGEILEQYFWREYDSNRLWEDRGYLSRTKHLHELISHYKEKGRRFKNFSKDLVDLAITDNFKIALIDKSSILEEIFRDLREYTGIHEDISKEIFWNSVKNQVSTQRLARIIQKNKIRNLIRLNPSYSIKEARLDYHPDITGKPKQFWNESLNNGITRFSAAIIQSRKIRRSINKKIAEENKLGALNLMGNTLVEDHWGRDKGNGNVITYPDCISYEITERAKKGNAVEFIQNKIAREISGGHTGNITARNYFLDFFKSIGNRNDETGVIKFQLELIPKGETLGGLINDQLHENLCIISYWGRSTKEIQRIGEITNAFVLGRFEENITSKDELVNFIMTKLNQGESALNGTKLESVGKKVIDGHVSSLEPLENLTPTTFHKDWFIEIMRRYEKDLKSDM
ncbi:MAG: hypothetical protein ACXADY_11665 [Candidatus Hodarchaeales archaeon]|jgi:hypothetical protein